MSTDFHVSGDEDELSLTDIPGVEELSLPAIHEANGRIVVIGKGHLDALATAWKLTRWDSDFPADFQQYNMLQRGGPQGMFTIVDLPNGEEVALENNALLTATKFAHEDVDPVVPGFELWVPSVKRAPFLLETEHTPREWILEREFGSKEEFAEQFGATSCTECEEIFDEPVAQCPECGFTPDAVTNNVEKLQDAHEGVLIIIGGVDPETGEYDPVPGSMFDIPDQD